jgi:hypothetical protein
MPTTTPKIKAAPKGGNLFKAPETVSFQLEGEEVQKVKTSAKTRQIPFSQWLREAAREKLARELAA